MPSTAVPRLRQQLDHCQALFERDREQDLPGVWMPTALERKAPSWGTSWKWFWLFPSHKLSEDPRSQLIRRHHMTRDSFARQLARATFQANITKQVVPHTLRHSYATHMLLAGCDLKTLQRLMGHASIKTTEIYLHVIESMSRKITSPLDHLDDLAQQIAPESPGPAPANPHQQDGQCPPQEKP